MDRRQRKTRRAIYTAFEELVSQEPYESITVADIIEKADIGRSTFYAHFETKDQLLSEMCTEMFDHVFVGVDKHCITHATLEAVNLKGRLAHLLYHLRDTHGAICGKLLKKHEAQFSGYFRGRLADLFRADMPECPPGCPQNLQLNMLISAFCEAVIWWFDFDNPCEPEELAAWFCECVGA